MANMMDYMTWRGDLPVSVAPWNPVDTMLCATICYVELHSYAADEQGMTLRELAPLLPLTEASGDIYNDKRQALFLEMSRSVRFADTVIRRYINRIDRETQFSAMLLDVPDGPLAVAFRGTDATLTGWKEDCCMSFETVPAQLAAVEYLREAIRDTEPGRNIVVTGHSKGGNLAAYAAAHLTPEEQGRLTAVSSLDGPGLDDATLASDGYARIRPILASVIPQDSVVGLLMGYIQDYTVVHSTGNGILQHDNFTWQLHGPAFEVMDSNTTSSQFVNTTVHDWLNHCSPEQRRNFVNYLFDVLEFGNASTTKDLSADKGRTLATVIAANRTLDPEAKKQFYHMLGQLVSSGAANAFGLLEQHTNALLAGLKEQPADLLAGAGNLLSELKEALPNPISVLKAGGNENAE